MSQPQVENPAETYENYLVPAIADPWTQVLLQYADVKPGQRVLDLACGTGSVARQVAPLLGAKGTVVALDISPEMLAVGRALPAPDGATIEWRQGDAITLDLPDGTFDLVLCQQGLQFFSDRPASLRAIRRVLTDGGRLVLSVWQALDRHGLYQALMEATARRLGTNVSDVALAFSLGDAEQLLALLNDAGFQAVEVTPRSLDIRFPSPERFVQITVLGAATSVPTFAHLSREARSELLVSVAREVESVAHRYFDGDTLTFPMFSHIAGASA